MYFNQEFAIFAVNANSMLCNAQPWVFMVVDSLSLRTVCVYILISWYSDAHVKARPHIVWTFYGTMVLGL